MLQTHRGHQDTLTALRIDAKKTKTFKALTDQWKKVFDTKLLGKRFYLEIANWFFWATRMVDFPQIRPDKDKDKNRKQNLSERKYYTTAYTILVLLVPKRERFYQIRDF